MQAPSADRAEIIPLSKEARYQKYLNQQNYQVIEKNYLIIPKQVGTLSIQPPKLIADVITTPTRRSNAFGSMFSLETKTKQISGKVIHITVQTPPAGLIIAKGLTLSERWSQQTDHFEVGEAISRTLTLTGIGIRAEQLPELMIPAVSDLKIYRNKPQLETTETSSGFNGLRKQVIAMIPTQAGTIQLPAIKLSWWNIETKRIETISLPKKQLTITATAPAKADVRPIRPAKTAAPSHDMTWQWLSLSLIIVWLLTIIIFFSRQRLALLCSKLSFTKTKRAVSGSC